MVQSWHGSLWRSTRVLVAGLAIAGSTLVAGGVGVGGAAPVSQPRAAEVGPITLITPTRVLDTRPSQPPGITTVGFDAANGTPITAGPLPANTTRRFRIAGQTFPQGTGTFTFPTAIYGVLINVTEVGPPGGGFLTVFPGSVSDAARPAASTLNPIAGVNFNFAVVATDPNQSAGAGYGSIAIYTTATVDVAVDVYGYFTAPASGGGNGWSPLGNTGTISTTNFLGTTDNQPLVVRTNNVERLRVDAAGNVGIGTTTPANPVEIAGQNALALTGFQPFLTLRDTNAGNAESRVQTAGGDLGFYTQNGIPAANPAMVIKSSRLTVPAGQYDLVGIGTTTLTAPTVSRLLVHGGALTGVVGRTNSDNIGVHGQSTGGAGIVGQSTSSTGVRALSNSGNLMDGLSGPPGGSFVPKFHIDNNGTYHAGSDFAEALPARGGRASYQPGDVLVLSEDEPGALELARQPNDPRVAGVYSTRPGVLGAEKNGETRVDADEVPLAIVGIVPTKASAENGPIRPGDLLTTAATPGHAMKASLPAPQGTLLGKALEPLSEGIGNIRVLVSLR